MQYISLANLKDSECCSNFKLEVHLTQQKIGMKLHHTKYSDYAWEQTPCLQWHFKALVVGIPDQSVGDPVSYLYERDEAAADA